MPVQHIVASLTKYIVAEFPASATTGAPAPDTPLVESGIVDSLGLFKLIAFVEDEFKVKVEPEEILIENFASINAITGLIQSKLPA